MLDKNKNILRRKRARKIKDLFLFMVTNCAIVGCVEKARERERWKRSRAAYLHLFSLLSFFISRHFSSPVHLSSLLQTNSINKCMSTDEQMQTSHHPLKKNSSKLYKTDTKSTNRPSNSAEFDVSCSCEKIDRTRFFLPFKSGFTGGV